MKPLDIEEASGSDSGSTPTEHAAWLKWASLALLVLQNSGVFLMMRYTRSIHGPLYYTTVTVWLTEFFKGLVCVLILLAIQLRDGGGWSGFTAQLHDELWVQRSETLRLGVPAACYTVQNNLLYLAVTHMSAAGSQVLYQSKTLSTALFSVTIQSNPNPNCNPTPDPQPNPTPSPSPSPNKVTMLGKRFKALQWASFLLLALGVALVQQQDSKWSAGSSGRHSPVLGATASLVAAGLSGFAGVYLELMFTRGSTSIWMRNVQLTIFTLPLQTLTVYQTDRAHIAAHGALHGFWPSTWAVVAIQVAGGLIVAIVIKYAGNILKTFAAVLVTQARITTLIQATSSKFPNPQTPSPSPSPNPSPNPDPEQVLAILVTCLVSYLLPSLGFVATPLFGLGVVIVIVSIGLYSRPMHVPCIDDDD
jgi:UDP-sugar transporter A1/2/3